MRVEAGDVLDGARLREICVGRGVDGVCHLAVQPPGVGLAPSPRKVNVQGTRVLLEACRQAGVGTLVYASSMSVYDFLHPAYLPVDEAHPVAPLQAYGEEKRRGEELCQEFGGNGEMGIPILRFSGVYGPGKRQGAVYNFARAVLLEETVRVEENRRVDLLYVGDAAEAMAVALERAGTVGTAIFNIGAGRPVALDELTSAIGRVAGREARIECGTEGTSFYMDCGRARQALDFAPLRLEDGLRLSIPWIEETLGDAD
jgi:nucleoside-diphosphate-sugar epimerase